MLTGKELITFMVKASEEDIIQYLRIISHPDFQDFSSKLKTLKSKYL